MAHRDRCIADLLGYIAGLLGYIAGSVGCNLGCNWGLRDSLPCIHLQKDRFGVAGSASLQIPTHPRASISGHVVRVLSYTVRGSCDGCYERLLVDFHLSVPSNSLLSSLLMVVWRGRTKARLRHPGGYLVAW